MKTSGIITLTTDFGLSDPYVAMMKGVILSINPGAKLIDISHDVGAGSIFQVAYLVQTTFSFFPKGTVHIAVIDPGVGGDRRPIAIETEDHFFIGPDNGTFWPVIENQMSPKIVHLSESRYFLPVVSHTFHGRDIFAPAAAHISRGVDLEMMGPIIKDPVKLNLPSPQQKGNILYGQVIRVDNFGNLITNIHKTELGVFLESTRPVIKIGKVTIEEIRHIYGSVAAGEPLALFGSSHYLEIAVNAGRASEYPGLRNGQLIGTEVRVYRRE